MIGRIGSARCASTFPNCIDIGYLRGSQEHSYDCLCRLSAKDKLGEVEFCQLIFSLFNYLVLIDPHIAFAGEHINVRA
jgi:hypothetical protein